MSIVQLSFQQAGRSLYIFWLQDPTCSDAGNSIDPQFYIEYVVLTVLWVIQRGQLPDRQFGDRALR